jgi:hypothetical protein
VDSLTEAYTIATKLGNEAKMGATALNMSVCHGRTGNYVSQLSWAEKALCFLRGVELGWKRHQAAYYRSFALCMMGENRKGLLQLQAFKEDSNNTWPAWSTQSVPLMEADIYAASGEDIPALRMASMALEQSGIEPLADRHAGMVARWVARTASHTGRDDEANDLINRLCSEIESFDLLDQAEIVCSRIWLGDQGGTTCKGDRELLTARLARLPAAVEGQLRRLGILS